MRFLIAAVPAVLVLLGADTVARTPAVRPHAAPPVASPLVWGEHGHRMIGRLAAEALPEEVPAFFRAAVAQLAYLNPEPDRWRARDERALDPAMDAKHAPEHYVDFELLPPGALVAPNRLAYADTLRAAGVDAATAGLLPWRMLELVQRLRVGFREWHAATDADERGFIEQRIINDAGILGHYVADASNPHHTTIHHNGWVGENPHGYTTDRTFHSRFESAFVRAQIDIAEVRRAGLAPVRPRAALRAEIWQYLADTHALVERLYQLEQQERFSETTRSTAHREFAVERLAAGATMLRDLWHTAWATGRDEPAGR